MRFSLLFFFGTIHGIWAFALSDSAKMVKYTPDFQFKEGVYVNFEMVKNNAPIPKSRIISVEDYSSPEFFDKLLIKDQIFFYDNLGNKSSLKVDKLWGYCRNGFVYINIEESFYRITYLGSISHFIANHTYYTNNNYQTGYNYYDPYQMGTNNQANTEARQYILDFNSGQILDYTEVSIETLLMSDPELHDEYVSLNNKKMRQMKFMYMRKFNEKHPIYFPQK